MIGLSYLKIKRFFDITLALLIIIILSPLFSLIYLLNYIILGSPVFFKQERPGLEEEIFFIFKFRSLTNKKDNFGKLLPDSMRLTNYGIFIRSFSLDELPQLYNIIKGEMSFVGPRPLRVQYLEYYSEEQKKRHRVKPGITGFTQVNGRNSIDWKIKLQMDIFYVENISFFLDLSILIKTFFVVLFRKNISSRLDGTNKPFSKEYN